MNLRLAIFGLITVLFISLSGCAGNAQASSEETRSATGMATIYIFRPSRFYSRWATPTMGVVGPGFRCSVFLKNKSYVRFQVNPSNNGTYDFDMPYSPNWQFRGGGISISVSRPGGVYYVGLLPSGDGYTLEVVSPSEAKQYLSKLKLAKRTTCR